MKNLRNHQKGTWLQLLNLAQNILPASLERTEELEQYFIISSDSSGVFRRDMS